MKKPLSQNTPSSLRAVFSDAARAIHEGPDKLTLAYSDPTSPRNGVRPGRWEGFPSSAMPPDSPVTVLGRHPDTGIVYCITTTGHFRALEKKIDVQVLVDLWAPRVDHLKWSFPAWRKKRVIKTVFADEIEVGAEVYDDVGPGPEPGEDDPDRPKKKVVKEEWYVGRIERDQAAECIMQEAGRRGDFDPEKQARGRGGWTDANENFIWHSGDWLWRSTGKKLVASRPMVLDEFLYVRGMRTVHPWDAEVSQDESPARRILEQLRTWNWQRPVLDPIFVLGWIVTALMGGALDARPILFTTGGAGVGKSTLLELIRNVLDRACVSTVNTTAAGIYQRQKLDALPVLIDELESEPGSTRTAPVIALMRVSYTGGDISRGSADHEAQTFAARNSFAAFAINAPPLNPQDKSRMALLSLSKLDTQDGIPFGGLIKISPETDCRMLVRQIMDGWRDFKERLLPNYFKMLAPRGMNSRAIDTFGTLLAAAELAVGSEALAELGLPIYDETALGELIADATRVEREEALDNWHECLDHLLQCSIDQWREGVKPTVGGICDKVRLAYTEPIYDLKERQDHIADKLREARERLQLVNLTIIGAGKITTAPMLGPCLAVPVSGPALTKLFADTKFQNCVWFSALKGGPLDVVVRNLRNGQKQRINGSVKHCLLVDLDAFEKFLAEREAGQAPAGE